MPCLQWPMLKGVMSDHTALQQVAGCCGPASPAGVLFSSGEEVQPAFCLPNSESLAPVIAVKAESTNCLQIWLNSLFQLALAKGCESISTFTVQNLPGRYSGCIITA